MLRRALLSLALVCVAPAVAGAQERNCAIAGDRSSRMEEAGELIVVFVDPFVVTCADGTELRANSGRLNETTRELHLVGEVFFQDPDRTLTSNEATYSSVTERLWAVGNVVFVNRVEGSTLRGPELEYFRANEERPEAQVFATRRPTLTLPPRDSTAADSEPLQIVADRVIILGDDDLSAFGTVVITRSDLNATSEEATYNSTTESLELRRNAVVRSDDQELAGEVINAELQDGSLEYIHALTRAVLRGEDLEVTAPDVQLFFASDTLQRVTARMLDPDSAQRSVALSRTFRIEADSLDAHFVAQLLTEVHAIGTARGETVDTTVTAAVGDSAVATDEGADGVADAPAVVAIGDADVAGDPEARPAAQAPPAAIPEDGDPTAREASEDPAAPVAADSLIASPPLGANALAGRGIIGSDWIRGDTIIAYFEPAADIAAEAGADSPEAPGDIEEPAAPEVAQNAPPAEDACEGEECPDTGAEEDEADVELRRLVAIGDALSLYRLAGENDPPDVRSNVSLLAAARIELDVVDGELQVATATGLQQGIYLEASTPAQTPPPPPVPGSTDTAPDPAAPRVIESALGGAS